MCTRATSFAMLSLHCVIQIESSAPYNHLRHSRVVSNASPYAVRHTMAPWSLIENLRREKAMQSRGFALRRHTASLRAAECGRSELCMFVQADKTQSIFVDCSDRESVVFLDNKMGS